MVVILLIIIAAILIRAVYEWRGVTKSVKQLPPEAQADVNNRVEARKARIIADGQRRHEERQKQSPLLYGWVKYNGKQYLNDHMLDYKRYPL